VDVTFAANGRRVPSTRATARTASVTRFLVSRSPSQQPRSRRIMAAFQRAGPGAKVLGREFLASLFTNVVVDIFGPERTLLAVVAHVFEEVLTRQVLALANDPRQAAVVNVDFVRHAALAAKVELD